MEHDEGGLCVKDNTGHESEDWRPEKNSLHDTKDWAILNIDISKLIKCLWWVYIILYYFYC